MRASVRLATVAALVALAGCGATTTTAVPVPPWVTDPSATATSAPVSTRAGAPTTTPKPAPRASASRSRAPVEAPRPGAAVTVTRVIDGDTFALPDGARVRVLGIDSCETSTPAGPRATTEARRLLAAGAVVLRAEPGTDRDRYGRLLRYVRLPDGRDFGTVMVAATHTAVYAGRGDASAAYTRALRAADGNGRTCGTRPTTVARQAPSVSPAPRVDTPRASAPPRVTRPRSGQSGHPCLPGETDGDGDGYCGESR